MADHHHHHDDHHDDADHHHEHGQGDDEMSFSERNRAHWNKQAATYMSDHFQKEFGDLINKITAFILANITWIGVDFVDPARTFEGSSISSSNNLSHHDDDGSTRKVRVLDYACGPGTITSALAGHATEYIGIDLSEKMVDEYNKRLSSSSLSTTSTSSTTTSAAAASLQEQYSTAQHLNARAYAGNLLAAEGPPPSLSGPEFSDFDLVVVGLGFHHFENLEDVTSRLVERVRPGGVFMIVDFLPHAKGDLGDGVDPHVIAHHGFTEETVRQLFTGAGLEDVDLKIMSEPVMLRGKAPRTPFLARGRKPS